MKCVLGLLNPTEGQIAVLGRSPFDPESRRRIGFAPEIPRFPDFLTAAEVLRLHGGLMEQDKAVTESQIRPLLRQAELQPDSAKPKRVRQFSKGMVRRLALAQALLGEPEFLILDEPTADLDPIGRRDVRNQLIRLRERGATVVLNSHLLSEVERVCDRVAIIHMGRLLAMGRVDELVPPGQDLESVFIDLVEKAGR